MALRKNQRNYSEPKSVHPELVQYYERPQDGGQDAQIPAFCRQAPSTRVHGPGPHLLEVLAAFDPSTDASQTEGKKAENAQGKDRAGAMCLERAGRRGWTLVWRQ